MCVKTPSQSAGFDFQTQVTNILVLVSSFSSSKMLMKRTQATSTFKHRNTLSRSSLLTTALTLLHLFTQRYKLNKYAHLQGLAFIHTCWSYVQTPCELDRHAVESRNGTFIVLHVQADSSDFGLTGEQSCPKCEIPCPRRRWTAVQNLMLLALTSAEKSVTVQTHAQNYKKNKETVNDISTPCLSACVDNKDTQTDTVWVWMKHL